MYFRASLGHVVDHLNALTNRLQHGLFRPLVSRLGYTKLVQCLILFAALIG